MDLGHHPLLSKIFPFVLNLTLYVFSAASRKKKFFFLFTLDYPKTHDRIKIVLAIFTRICFSPKLKDPAGHETVFYIAKLNFCMEVYHM